MNEYFLYPSNIFVARTPTKVTTILGSCVAVTLWDKELKYGGINHYLLPRWNGKNLKSPMYGDIAIKTLIDKMIKMGSVIDQLEAKVFGGAKVLNINHEIGNIGQANVNLAFELLNEFGIKIVKSDVGGSRSRKIQFFTHSGKVILNYI